MINPGKVGKFALSTSAEHYSQVTDVKVNIFCCINIVCFVCRRSGQQQKKSQPLNLFLRKGRKDVFRQ